jgi:hypothetical protein
MDFNKSYKIIKTILLSSIVVLLIIVLPVAFQERDFYQRCNEKELCDNHAINPQFCEKYYNYKFNSSYPIINITG